MSKLEFYARPLVAFDPANKAHRRWYHQFVEYRGWGHCPVRFICPDATGFDLTIMIRNQLVEYYVQKEFAKESVAKKQHLKLVNQKAKKVAKRG
jgi:hypothetical protein